MHELKKAEIADVGNARRKKLRVFVIGVGVRLFGLALIVIGDGHANLWSKALVVIGVIISVAGIGVLRYLLLQPLLTKIGGKIKAARV